MVSDHAETTQACVAITLYIYGLSFRHASRHSASRSNRRGIDIGGAGNRYRGPGKNSAGVPFRRGIDRGIIPLARQTS